MVYNGTGTASISSVLNGVNDLTGGLFGVFFLIMIFGIVFFMNKADHSREAIVGATFVTMMAAILGFYIGFIQDYHLGISVVAFIGSLAMLLNKN